MRRLALFLALVAAGCAVPKPCTRALCPIPGGGSYRVTGWNRSVTVGSGTPAIPIVSDSQVDVLDGTALFVNGTSTVTAPAGASFSFDVSSSAVPSLVVTSGTVTVQVSTAAPAQAVPHGAPYSLPVP